MGGDRLVGVLQPVDHAVATHDVEGGAHDEEGRQLLGNDVRRLLHKVDQGTLRYGSLERNYPLVD